MSGMDNEAAVRIVVSGSGYSVVSRHGYPRPDLNELASLGELRFDKMPELDQWLLEKVLRIPKNRKFMGLQDKLAVVAAARALIASDLIAESDGHGFQHLSPLLAQRCGVYMAVGYIPFEYEEIAQLSQNSQIDGRFSMPQFSSLGIAEVNPLLTFRCLPNMPAFHVSMNFSLQGPYVVSYPDIGQFYQVLQQAVTALRLKQIDFALVGGVADQNNFLVRHQLRKLNINSQALDCAAFLLLERKSHTLSRGIKPQLDLIATQSSYQSHDILSRIPDYQESVSVNDKGLQFSDIVYAGPASLALALSLLSEQSNFSGEIQHRVSSTGNINAASHWQAAARSMMALSELDSHLYSKIGEQ